MNGQQLDRQRVTQHRNQVVGRSHFLGDTAQRPGQDQDDHRVEHGLEPLVPGVDQFLETHDDVAPGSAMAAVIMPIIEPHIRAL